MESLSEKQKKDFDKWVGEREAELFEVEEFKQIGKESDYYFQMLVFMQRASAQMSLAYTLTDIIENFPKELNDEFREIAIRNQELQEKIRYLRK